MYRFVLWDFDKEDIMDKSPVILKGSKSGIELTLDPEMDFPDLLEAVKEKFSSGSHFL